MPTAAKVIMFPSCAILECRACDNHFRVGSDYDFAQDRLCNQCLILKEALRHKRAMVPHKPIGLMTVIGMGFMAAAILIVAAVGVFAVLAVKHFAARGF